MLFRSQRDNLKLIDSLKELRDLGNTVIVVEHDKEMIQSADYVVDLGPGAGEHGGTVVSRGAPAEILKAGATSLTAAYLSGERGIETPKVRRSGNGKRIVLSGASGNNLRKVDLSIPLGAFVCVTGVSGSGKSSLITETLYRILARKFHQSKDVPLPYGKIEIGRAHV